MTAKETWPQIPIATLEKLLRSRGRDSIDTLSPPVDIACVKPRPPNTVEIGLRAENIRSISGRCRRSRGQDLSPLKKRKPANTEAHSRVFR